MEAEERDEEEAFLRNIQIMQAKKREMEEATGTLLLQSNSLLKTNQEKAQALLYVSSLSRALTRISEKQTQNTIHSRRS